MRRNSMKKIMVVDDEENIRFLYQEELRDDGYEVVTAGSGEKALELLPMERPDLITLDIKMPGMDGMETLRKIKEIDKDIPVILCTAYGQYKQDFSSWASDAYVVKSADLKELKDTIKGIMSKKTDILWCRMKNNCILYLCLSLTPHTMFPVFHHIEI